VDPVLKAVEQATPRAFRKIAYASSITCIPLCQRD
jgi:hypothetical protein